MCESCLRLYLDDVPVPAYDRGMAELVADLQGYYSVHETGGRLHVAVDDFNLSDEVIDWCLSGQPEDLGGPLEPPDLAWSIARRLRNRTVPERALVVGIAHGYIAAPCLPGS